MLLLPPVVDGVGADIDILFFMCMFVCCCCLFYNNSLLIINYFYFILYVCVYDFMSICVSVYEYEMNLSSLFVCLSIWLSLYFNMYVCYIYISISFFLSLFFLLFYSEGKKKKKISLRYFCV